MFRTASLSLICLAAAGCATTPGETVQGDPWEGFNREMFLFNQALDEAILSPAATVYETLTPKFARTGVGNVISNLNSPVVFANDVLQGEGGRASDTATRFLINSTLGVAGLWDAAEYFGLEGHSEDFGQTLAVWGVDSGPYLVLPVVGPTTPRDVLGGGVDRVFDPLTWSEFDGRDELQIGRGVLGALNGRVAADDAIDALNDQPEPYTALRRFYENNRQAAIRNGREDPDADADLPDFEAF